jgi:diguanylate cyclase (GGDEF)-like protein/PAS domain S-box-containing protein
MESANLQYYMKQLWNDDTLFIVALDTKGRVTYANRRVEQVFGKLGETLEGVSWLQLTVAPEQLSLMAERFGAMMTGEIEPFAQVADVDAMSADGQRLRILWSNHLLRDVSGRINGSLSFGQDITEQNRSQFRLAMHQDLSRILGESGSFSEAVNRFIQTVCERFGWDFGEVWMVDNLKDVMVWHSCWGNDSARFAAFEELSRKINFAKGEGMPGLIWAEEKPTWIEDVTKHARFARRYAAAAIGLHSAFGFPLFVGNVVVGSMAFFSQRIQPPENGMIALFDSVGIQLGNYYQRKKVEQQLQIWDGLFRNSGEAMFVTDAAPKILAVNDACTRMTGYQQEEIIGKSPAVLQSSRHDRLFYEEFWAALNTAGTWQGEIWDRRKDGSEYPIGLTITRIKNEQSETTHYIATFADISERKAAEERIRYLVHHDALTGLPNRTLLTEQLDRFLLRARRQNRQVIVLSIDIDRFKVVNDSLGHTMGDMLLQQLAQRLQDCMGDEGVLSRPGGDEFVVVLPNVAEIAAIIPQVERIVEGLRQTLYIGEMEFNLTASIGISVFPGDGRDRDTLIKNADVAMNYAKETGRNQYLFFTAELNAMVSERLRIETLLRKALERKELLLHFQPQVDLRTNRVIGIEALVRWNQPEEGMIPPNRFIPMAEESGLIVPLGDWILVEACRQWQKLAKAGLPPVTMAVNISAVQFYEATFLEKISRRVKRYGMEAFLEIEVTEGIMMRNVPATLDIMHKLKAIGCKLSIDDFGTGYSSLGYLSRFPLDKLKIDQSFVRAMLASQTNMAIVDTIIRLAGNLNLRVIAEGVETAAELNALRARHCDEVQGYHLARPMPMDELIRWWQQWNQWNQPR